VENKTCKSHELLSIAVLVFVFAIIQKPIEKILLRLCWGNQCNTNRWMAYKGTSYPHNYHCISFSTL